MSDGHTSAVCPVCGDTLSREATLPRHMKRKHPPSPVKEKNYRGQCVSCGRNMRAKRAKKENHPNTVAYGSRGLCHACDQARARRESPVKLTPCTSCSRTMRPYGKRKEDHPNTVSYAARGMCHRCWSHERNSSNSYYIPEAERIDLTAASKVRRLVEARYTGSQREYMLDILGIGGDL